LALSLATGEACAQGPVTSQAQNRDSVGQYEKFELTFTLSGTYANPFDTAEIDVRVTFTEPDGTQKVVPAFYYMEFDVDPGSNEHYVNGRNLCWKARFAPTLVGEHSYQITVTDSNGTQTVPGAKTFQCVSSQQKGFIRVDARDPFLLRRTTGEQYIPIGHNVSCATNYTGLAWWTDHFQKAADQGVTWARVWMSTYCAGLNIEWSPTGAEYTDPAYFHGVGRYGLEIAWKIDRLIELAEQQGIAIQLTLQYHQQFVTNLEWPTNPYNGANAADGGWLTSPQQFFTDAEARRLTKNKYRYIVARWGYSTVIHSWELWNEVEYTSGGSSNLTSITAWHAEMAQFLKDTDPFDHLVTTSTTAGDYARFDAIWTLPSIDLVQVHSYTTEVIANMQTSTQRLRKYGKPFFTGEFGLSVDDPVPELNINSLPEPYHSQLIDGRHLHHGIWAAFHLQSGGHLWWFNYIAAHNLFPVYKPLAVYADGESLGDKGLGRAIVTLTTQKQETEPFFQANAPGITSFDSGPEQTTFTVDQYGQINEFWKQTSYLHGSNKAQWRSDPILQTNFDSSAVLRLYIGRVSGWGSNSLNVLLDGVVVASLAPPNGASNLQLEVTFPAGAHNVQVRNTGQDWFIIDNYGFSVLESSILRYIGLSGQNAAYLWIYDIGSQYGYTNNGTITDATFRLSGLDEGSYRIQYYGTEGIGGIVGSEQASVADGVLTGVVSSFSKDIAVKVKPITIGTFSLTYTANAHGSITGLTLQTVDYGADGAEVTAVPDTGYHFLQWNDGVLTATRADTNVTGDINVSASFGIDTFTLTYTADAHGSIIGITPQVVDYGTDGAEVTAVPGTGYHFLQWNDGVLTAARADTVVTADLSVTAIFAANTSHTLTYTADAHGSISGLTPQTVDYGADGAEVTAVPDTGHRFLQWSDGVLMVARTDTNVTGDISVSASFAIDTFTLTYTADAHGSITGLTPQTVDYGADGAEVTAVPDTGYRFVEWSDGSLTATRTDTNVTEDISVTASFTPDVARLAIVPDTPADIAVEQGSEVVLAVIVSGGTQPYTYDWKKEGSWTTLATTPTLTLHNVHSSDAGKYYVEVLDSNLDTAESRHADLTVALGLPVARGLGLGILTLASAFAVVKTIRRKK
jgi:hypothetical protein